MKHNKSPLLFLTISSSILLIISLINASNLIPETCKKLSQLDPKVYYDFCEAALGTAPGSTQATTLTQLGSVSFTLDISQVEPILTKIDTLLENPTPELDPFALDALRACSGLYSGARDVLVSGLEEFEAGEYVLANVSASVGLGKVVSCESGFKREQQGGLVYVLSTENSDFVKLVAISIGFTKLLCEM